MVKMQKCCNANHKSPVCILSSPLLEGKKTVILAHVSLPLKKMNAQRKLTMGKIVANTLISSLLSVTWCFQSNIILALPIISIRFA